MEETFDFAQWIVGFAGIRIENFVRTNGIETLNSKLEILNKPKTQDPNVQNVSFGFKI